MVAVVSGIYRFGLRGGERVVPMLWRSSDAVLAVVMIGRPLVMLF